MNRGVLILFSSISACGPKVLPGGGPAWSGPIRESALIPRDSSRAPLPDRLFETDVPLTFTLEADFHRLQDDREQESEERPGRVLLEGDAGEARAPRKLIGLSAVDFLTSG